MSRSLRFAVRIAMLACFAYQAAVHAQHTAADRLSAAASASSLAALTKPWHLKMKVELFDAKGDVAQQGTVEEWRADTEARTVIMVGDTTTTEYEHAGASYRASQGAVLPELVNDLLQAIVHPGPDESQLTGTTPELRKQAFGKVTVDCVMLSRSLKPIPGRLPPQVPIGFFPTYCLNPAGDQLQVAFSLENLLTLWTQTSKFAGQTVLTGVTISGGPVKWGVRKSYPFPPINQSTESLRHRRI